MIGCGIKKAIFVAIVCCVLSIQIYSQDNKKDLTFADAWNYYSDQEQDLLCIGIRHGIGTVIAAMQGSLEFVESIPQFSEDHIAAIREYYEQVADFSMIAAIMVAGRAGRGEALGVGVGQKSIDVRLGQPRGSSEVWRITPSWRK